MPFLLDANVLIARIDPRHEHHERVTRCERDNASEHLVTCPLTQNGFVRIFRREERTEKARPITVRWM